MQCVERDFYTENVTEICGYTFYNCTSLENIIIPKTVVSIEGLAFENCKQLKNIYYNGSKEMWEKISIEGLNDALKMPPSTTAAQVRMIPVLIRTKIPIQISPIPPTLWWTP